MPVCTLDIAADLTVNLTICKYSAYEIRVNSDPKLMDNRRQQKSNQDSKLNRYYIREEKNSLQKMYELKVLLFLFFYF